MTNNIPNIIIVIVTVITIIWELANPLSGVMEGVLICIEEYVFMLVCELVCVIKREEEEEDMEIEEEE